MEARHAQERKQLQAKITCAKKTARSSKQAKKQVLVQVKQWEADLEAAHARERASSDSLLADSDDSLKEESPRIRPADEPGVDLDPVALLAQIDNAPVKQVQTEITDNLESGRSRKPNRQKARLARREQERQQIRDQAALESAQIPNVRQTEKDEIHKKVTNLKLVEHSINSDGHCLYSAISDQLRVRRNQQISYTQLRAITADYIRTHADEFLPFLVSEEGDETDIGVYADKIEQSGEWGGELEILALAQSLALNVCLVQMGPHVHTINGTSESHQGQSDIYLSYYRHLYGLGAHYNSLRPKVADS